MRTSSNLGTNARFDRMMHAVEMTQPSRAVPAAKMRHRNRMRSWSSSSSGGPGWDSPRTPTEGFFDDSERRLCICIFDLVTKVVQENPSKATRVNLGDTVETVPMNGLEVRYWRIFPS
jgi:hypothetical protein